MQDTPNTFETPQSSIDLIYKLDTQGLFTYVNPIMLDFLETSLENILGTHFSPFIRDDKKKEVMDFYAKQISEVNLTSYLEVPIINTSGKEAWVGQTCQLLIEDEEIREILVVARDISERIEAKRQAKINEEKYQHIIENINLGLMEVDLDEKIIYANQSFCKMTAYDLDELIGKNARDIFLVDDDFLSNNKMKEIQGKRKGGESSAYELKIKRKDGKSLWMIISGAPVLDSAGRIIGSLGIHNDITDRKMQEIAVQELLMKVENSNAELLKQQKFLNAVNAFSAKLINTYSVKEIVEEITSNVVQDFGFTDCVIYLINANKNLLSQVSAFGVKEKDGELVNPIFIEVGKGIVGTVAETGKPILVNDISNDPRYIMDVEQGLSELAVPIISEGEVIGVIDSESPEKDFYTEKHLETLTTIANLTASKIRNAINAEQKTLAELALKESETKLRSVIDSAMDAVITIDEFGCITEWNVQAEQLFGFSHQEALGETLADLIVPEDYREAHKKGMSHFLKTGEGPVLNQRIEIVGLHKSKEIFPIELSIVPVLTDDQYFFSAFIRDIRERKKVEEEMQMALEKEKELREMKSRFVSMTSHEFRTPLTTIKSNVELLQFQLNKTELSDNAKVNRNFERINSEIDRLNGLMNDILMIGRLESGKIPFKPIKTDLLAFCTDLLEQYQSGLTNGQQIGLTVSGKPVKTKMDINIYEHILGNLISNALKYSAEALPPEVHLNFDHTPMHVEISVKDFGIGISEKDQKSLFESFFRAENVGNIQGSGLGLTIVKQFLDMHHATISVESELKKGSCFSILQPLDFIETEN